MALNPWIRLFVYGLLGFMYEIVFTAAWELVQSKFTDFSLKGYSSIWSFFIYGTCTFCGERFYNHTKTNFSAVSRGLVYMQMAYSWEFVCGLILRQFDACTWDYSEFRLDVMGLIALEYAPFWFLTGLFQEFIYDYLLNLSQCQHKVSSVNGKPRTAEWEVIVLIIDENSIAGEFIYKQKLYNQCQL